MEDLFWARLLSGLGVLLAAGIGFAWHPAWWTLMILIPVAAVSL
jgi:hypothetical protein